MKKRKRKIGIITKKKPKSYKKYTLYYIIFGILFITISLILSFTVFFNITDIKITGKSKYTPNKIISAISIKKGDNLILANTKKTEDDVMNFFKDLDSVKIKKKFPNTLQIECVAAVPLFYYKKNKNSYIVVSKNNRVIKDNENKKPANIFKLVVNNTNPKTYGIGEFFKLDEEKQEQFEIIKSAITNENIHNITKICLNKDKIYIIFEDRVTLEIDDVSKTQYLLNLSKIMLKNFIGSLEKGRLVYLNSKKSMHFIPVNHNYFKTKKD